MWIQEESKVPEGDCEPPASEADGRWDVGLGERLVQTIWNWLGRDGREGRGVETPSSDKLGAMRKAA